MTQLKKHRIFLDVGTHIGQTLEEVTKPEYGFDTIIAFEPMPLQFKEAKKLYGDRVMMCNYGLSDKGGLTTIYGDNSNMGTSIYKEKKDVDATETRVVMYRASKFFETFLDLDAEIIMKLNCEGSEIAIMNDLIDNGQIWKLHNVMIDFDIKKVPGKEHLAEELIARMKSIHFNRYSLCEDVMIGDTHQKRIANWLRMITPNPNEAMLE